MVHFPQATDEELSTGLRSSTGARRKSFFHRLSLRVTKNEVDSIQVDDFTPATARPSTSSKKKHVIKARRSLSGKRTSHERLSASRGKSLPTEDLDTLTPPEVERSPSAETTPRSRPSKRKKMGTVGRRRGALQVGHATAAAEELSDVSLTVPLEKRHRILQELRDTERSYATSLHMVNVVFIAPLRAKVGTDEEILTSAEMAEIFGALEAIQEESQDMWERIDAVLAPSAWSESTLIGPLFLDLAQNEAFREAYHQYVATYERGLTLIRKATKEETVFGQFMASRQLPCDSHSLSSLLILPIQRIPRYQLLLRDLIKSTPPHHPDQSLLTSALEQFEHFTTSLDERTRSVPYSL